MVEKMTKQKILRILAEIWKGRDGYPRKKEVAQMFLETDFDPEQIEKHLGIQFKWDCDPSLDENLKWSEYHHQDGILHLRFSESGRDEVGSTLVTLTFNPFEEERGLTLSMRMYLKGSAGIQEEKQTFSLKSVLVNSIALNSDLNGSLLQREKSVIFKAGNNIFDEPRFLIKIKKEVRGFNIEIEIPRRGNAYPSYVLYSYRDLQPVA